MATTTPGVRRDPYERLRSVIDVDKLHESRIAVIGVGGSAGLIADLNRCGVRRFTLVDPDIVSEENLGRQHHDRRSVGKPKVEAMAQALRAMDPQCEVETHAVDVTRLSGDTVRSVLGKANLLIAVTDSHDAQAWVNRAALMTCTPALFAGLAEGAGMGEIVWWQWGAPSCYRCIMARRYALQEAARAEGRRIDPASDGATIWEIRFLDAIVGMLAVGLLTRGADNKYGRLMMEHVGDRQLIQIKLDPAYAFHGRDIFRELLGVPADNDLLFNWVAMARRDGPKDGPCEDCANYLLLSPGSIH